MKDLNTLNKYLNLEIYRWALICIIAAPIPVATMKLKGLLLDEFWITIGVLGGSVIWMLQTHVVKFSARTLLVCGAVLDLVACIALSFGYITDASIILILVGFPLASTVVQVLSVNATNKIVERLKDTFGEEFKMAEFHAKRGSWTATGAAAGQLAILPIYHFYNVDAMQTLVLVELVASTVMVFAEISKYKLLVKLGVIESFCHRKLAVA